MYRDYYENGTNGTIMLDGEFICYSIELPWKNNTKRISCIPEGKYLLEKRRYPKHGEQIGIPQVLGREAILIHTANVAQKELQGCIAPVSKLIAPGVGEASRIALQKLKSKVYACWEKQQRVYLHIIGRRLVYKQKRSTDEKVDS